MEINGKKIRLFSSSVDFFQCFKGPQFTDTINMNSCLSGLDTSWPFNLCQLID